MPTASLRVGRRKSDNSSAENHEESESAESASEKEERRKQRRRERKREAAEQEQQQKEEEEEQPQGIPAREASVDPPRGPLLPLARGRVQLAPVQQSLPPTARPLHGGGAGLHRAAQVLRPRHVERRQRSGRRPRHPQRHGPRHPAAAAHPADQLAVCSTNLTVLAQRSANSLITPACGHLKQHISLKRKIAPF
ncbi:hypothetical protein CEXT_121081 [Caerostris extrusa]|uniref:Uncharacterized protein n=1 Tax=Caerostris extrusa TaxID=172846 RepID=A0AAV4SV58_CAEEX|nr:hypothetical protein CEXT_121081 [Caerostris extrusa]